jgi:NitT/TauT family transport system substrate-binding protein
MRRYVRQLILVAIVLFVATGVLFASGQTETGEKTLKKASFRLNWKITGAHAAYYLGHKRGFFEEEGIDLALMEGSGSKTAAELTSNKQDTFGLADAAALIPLVEKGLPIKCVAMISPRTALAVIARKDSGMTSIKDIEGKRLAVTAGGIVGIWPAVVAANNLDADKVKLVYVDASAKIPMVLEKKADALLGASTSQNFVMEDKGVPAVTFDFADHGVNVLNLGIWVHNDLIEEDPELIRAFLRALKKCFEALPKEKDEAIRLIMEAKPELKLKPATQETEGYMGLLKSPNCPDAAFLYNCPKDWEMTRDIMVKYRNIDAKMTASDYYTNEFLPK